MKNFAAIYERAAKRKGGPAALDEMLSKPKSRRALTKVGDDRYLSMMAKRIYQAGFVWRVVENKWPGIEEAFFGFEPKKVARISEVRMAKLLKDDRIIKHPGKTAAIRANAHLVLDVAAEHGSFGGFVASWPDDDTIGLWDYLKRNGSRLGGMTGPYALRALGKDTFILSKDVVTALIDAKVVSKNPSGKRDLRAVQDAFNAWRLQSRLSHTEMSQVLAFSVP